MTKALEVNPRHQVGDVNPETRTGTCSKCGPTKVYRNSGYKGLVYWRCGGRAKEYANERCLDPDVYRANRNARFLRLYGITVEQYDQRLAEQGGTCARCQAEPVTMRHAVDHSHDTGAVRGLLCASCNTYLGRLEARLEMLVDDLAYLQNPLATKFAARLVEMPVAGW